MNLRNRVNKLEESTAPPSKMFCVFAEDGQEPTPPPEYTEHDTLLVVRWMNDSDVTPDMSAENQNRNLWSEKSFCTSEWT